MKREQTFEDNTSLTLGVEEEFMFCDPETGDLVQRVDEFMERLPEDVRNRYSYELLLSEIETNTPVTSNVDDAMAEVIKLRRVVNEICRELDIN